MVGSSVAKLMNGRLRRTTPMVAMEKETLSFKPDTALEY